MSDFMKVFSGTSILVNRLAYMLDELGVASMIKDNKESGRLAGFGTLGQSVDLFINPSDFDKAKEAIQNFEKEISK
ncbi:putative signal transducing protein [Tenacibaculum amylolyticum]|uniref:putative signal transducing protein n=1 Tax=Tenacibaculum amylolyticum TaxID=104269 RepID=UPI00389555E2